MEIERGQELEIISMIKSGGGRKKHMTSTGWRELDTNLKYVLSR